MKKLRPCLHAVFAIGLLAACDTQVNDPNAKFVAMADSLITRMTVDEKISQLHFNAPAIPHLGLKAWNYWGEALHGVARYQEATVFPQVIGLGSTWDPEKISQMSKAIATEARVFHNSHGLALTFFSPTVNVARDPRWGRS